MSPCREWSMRMIQPWAHMLLNIWLNRNKDGFSPSGVYTNGSKDVIPNKTCKRMKGKRDKGGQRGTAYLQHVCLCSCSESCCAVTQRLKILIRENIVWPLLYSFGLQSRAVKAAHKTTAHTRNAHFPLKQIISENQQLQWRATLNSILLLISVNHQRSTSRPGKTPVNTEFVSSKSSWSCSQDATGLTLLANEGCSWLWLVIDNYRRHLTLNSQNRTEMQRENHGEQRGGRRRLVGIRSSF